MSDKGQVFVILLFADERLLRGESHDRHADGFVDPVIDDSRRLSRDIETMPLRHGVEGHTQEVVFRDDFTHVQSIVKTLHAVGRRTAARVLGGERPVPVEREIARNLGNDIRQVIGDRRLIEIEFGEELAGLQPPLGNDLLLTLGQNLGQLFGITKLLGGHATGFHATRIDVDSNNGVIWIQPAFRTPVSVGGCVEKLKTTKFDDGDVGRTTRLPFGEGIAVVARAAERSTPSRSDACW